MHAPGTPASSTTIADIVFAAADARVIVAVEPSIDGADRVADELTDAATHAPTATELAAEVQEIADVLDLHLHVEAQGTTAVYTLRSTHT